MPRVQLVTGEKYKVFFVYASNGTRVLSRTDPATLVVKYHTKMGWPEGQGLQVGDNLEVFYTAKSRIRFKKVNGDTITPYMEICANKSSNQQIHCKVVINGKTIPAIIDLGATSNFMCTRTRE